MAVEVGAGLTGYRAPSGEVTIPIPGSSLEHMPPGSQPLVFAGHGRVVTYSIVYVPTTRFKEKAPYALAVVELDEGARLLALVDGAAADSLAIDAEVRFSRRDAFGYHFELAASS